MGYLLTVFVSPLSGNNDRDAIFFIIKRHASFRLQIGVFLHRRMIMTFYNHIAGLEGFFG